MLGEPKLRAILARTRIETAMRSVIFRQRAVQVVATLGIDGLIRMLSRIRHIREIVVEQAGKEPSSENGFRGGPTHPKFTPPMRRRPVDSFRGDFRLEDRRERLRLPANTRARPIE